MLYIVCYDIQSNRMRYRVCKTLLDFGYRVQHSVFECRLSSERLAELKQRLSEIELDDTDSIRIYPQCGKCEPNVAVLGCDRREEEAAFVVI